MIVRSFILALALLITSCSDKIKNRITVLFDRVDNIEEGSNVHLKGFLIGEVRHLALANNGVWVDIELTGDTKIPVGSKFTIIASSLGFTHVAIEPSDKTVYLSSADTVTGLYLQKGLLDDLISDSTNQEKVYQLLDEVNDKLKKIIEEAKRDSIKKSTR